MGFRLVGVKAFARRGSNVAKMTLREAAQLVGLSVNGMRSRAKADPVRYGLTRDNAGRLLVEVDPSKVELAKGSKSSAKGSTAKASKLSAEARLAVLQVQLESSERARVSAESERDHWRGMAEALAAKRWRFWPF